MNRSGGVDIKATSGATVNIKADVVGRSSNSGNAMTACDFIWKSRVIKALCYPQDQGRIQRYLDDFLAGQMTAKDMRGRLSDLSENLLSQIGSEL